MSCENEQGASLKTTSAQKWQGGQERIQICGKTVDKDREGERVTNVNNSVDVIHGMPQASLSLSLSLSFLLPTSPSTELVGSGGGGGGAECNPRRVRSCYVL